MGRLNRYLLTHYPLVWNMRLHWVLPVLLLLHVVFYIAGLIEPQRITQLSYSTTNFQPVATSLAVLIGVLVIIGWLLFYLRNNAFKSFYPLRRAHLFAEFIYSILVVFLASTLSVTHQAGRYQRLRTLTQNVDLVKEGNTVAIAYHFLPFNGSQFEIYNSCDSLRYRNRVATLATGETGPPTDRTDYYLPDSSVERSYLHFCDEPPLHSYAPATLDRYEVGSVARKWMLSGQRNAVRDALNAYLELVRKYGGSARFDVEAQVAEVFATPRFLVRRSFLLQHNGTNPINETPEYITTQSVHDALSTIVEVRKGVLSSDLMLAYFYLYWTLAAALLLFSFRITRFRTWFGAGIGVGVWIIIFSVLAALTRGTEDVVMPAFFAVVIGSVAFTAMNLSARRRKAASGFTFLWTIWSLPILGIALMYYIRSLLRRTEYRYDGNGNLITYEPSPLAAWINVHGPQIALINLVLVLILVAAYVIPLARRWQAAPEE